MDQKSNHSDRAASSPTGKAPRIILSRELLGNDKLVVIRHQHEDYRLHVTASGKLLLTK